MDEAVLTLDDTSAFARRCLAASVDMCATASATMALGDVGHRLSDETATRPAKGVSVTLLAPDRAAAFGLPAWTASWWKEHETELQAALAVANVAAPHLRELALFLLPRLPRLVRASSTIKGMGEQEYSRLLPLAEALGHRWMAFNGKRWMNTITADVDHASWQSALFDMVAQGALPKPLAIVVSPWKGSAHLIWAFERPLRRGCPQQMRLRKGLSRGLVLAFGACSRFSNTLQKNPWHRSSTLVAPETDVPCGDPAGWESYQAAGTGLTYHTTVMRTATVSGRDLLLPLLDHATGHGVMLLGPRIGQEAQGGRHIPLSPVSEEDGARPQGSRLFHCAARTVRRACTGDAERILRIVERTAVGLGSPADRGAIEAISASITRWMNSHWWGPLDGRPGLHDGVGAKQVDFGVMTGEAADKGGEALEAWRKMPKIEKRQMAAARTNALRTARVDEAIRVAVRTMLREGLRLTQKAVAQRAGVSAATVHRRWHSLDLSGGGEGDESSDGIIRPCGTSISSSHATPVTLSMMTKAHPETLRNRGVAERQAIRIYEEQAVRLRQRGAMTEEVVPVGPEASKEVRDAYRNARMAQADLLRRVRAREGRVRAQAAARERQAWHEAHKEDDGAWQARLAGLIIQRERAVEAFADWRRTGLMMEMMFNSIIKAEYRARRRARGEPEAVIVRRRRQPMEQGFPGPDEIDLAISW
jgi:DNA-binding transcriptional regulator YiaG